MGNWRINVPLGDGEDLISFCQRLSIVSGSPEVEGFLVDIGTTATDVLKGTDDAVRRVARFARADEERLRAATLMRDMSGPIYNRGYRLNGHPVGQRHVERFIPRFCPLCRSEDRLRWPGLGQAAPFMRGEWRLKWIRSCPVHGVALVVADEEQSSGEGGSSIRSASRIGSLPEMGIVPLSPSGMEIYLRRRAALKPAPGTPTPGSDWPNGIWPGGIWLDTLHLSAVADFCEVVGLLARMEPRIAADDVRVRSLSIHALSFMDQHGASDLGWRILSAGPETLRHLVERFTAMACARGGIMKPGGILGPLHAYLDRRPHVEALQGVRDMVRATIAASTPVAPATRVFDEQINKRSMASIHTAAKDMGMHHKRLQKLLVLGGVMSQDERVFRLDERVDALLREIAETMSLKQAGAYINAPRVQMDLLVKSGILKASAVGGDGEGMERSFAKRDLDEFLERLSRSGKQIHSASIKETMPELTSIPSAARQARCSAVDIVGLIFEERISVSSVSGDFGYMAIRVSPMEIRDALYGAKVGLSSREVMRRERWSENLLAFLMRNSLLRFEIMTNPITRLKQSVIFRDSIDEFKKDYILINEISEKLNMPEKDARKHLLYFGIEPIYRGAIGSRLYSRRLAKIALPYKNNGVAASIGDRVYYK